MAVFGSPPKVQLLVPGPTGDAPENVMYLAKVINGLLMSFRFVLLSLGFVHFLAPQDWVRMVYKNHQDLTQKDPYGL